MDIARLNMNILTQTAITALKNAYEECGDKAAKESIITAFKAIIQLHHDLGHNYGHADDYDHEGNYDPSEYCAAV